MVTTRGMTRSRNADRIVAADERVGRVVLDAEARRIDAIEDLQEDVFRLRELRIAPGAVLVVVLQAEHDVAALGVLERATQPVDGPRDPFASGQARDAAAR